MSIGLRLDGLELEINGEVVRYAIEGVWHLCSLDDFLELLARNFKPKPQTLDE